jgi:RNA polymerase sigma-70 factor (ECF subfamily)
MKNKTDVKKGKGGQNGPTALALRAMLEGPARKEFYEYTKQLCGDPDEAEELMQEACYRALKAEASYDPAQALLPWLCVIAHNAFVNSRTCCARRWKVSLDWCTKPDGEVVAELIADSSEPVLEKLAREETWEEVAAALDRLSESCQEVIKACDIEGLSYERAAVRLRVPMGTVRSRLARARAYLRREVRRATCNKGGLLP